MVKRRRPGRPRLSDEERAERARAKEAAKAAAKAARAAARGPKARKAPTVSRGRGSGRGNGRESDSLEAALERGGLGDDDSIGRLSKGAGGGEVTPPRELLQMGESWIELPDDDG